MPPPLFVNPPRGAYRNQATVFLRLKNDAHLFLTAGLFFQTRWEQAFALGWSFSEVRCFEKASEPSFPDFDVF